MDRLNTGTIMKHYTPHSISVSCNLDLQLVGEMWMRSDTTYTPKIKFQAPLTQADTDSPWISKLRWKIFSMEDCGYLGQIYYAPQVLKKRGDEYKVCKDIHIAYVQTLELSPLDSDNSKYDWLMIRTIHKQQYQDTLMRLEVDNITHKQKEYFRSVRRQKRILDQHLV